MGICFGQWMCSLVEHCFPSLCGGEDPFNLITNQGLDNRARDINLVSMSDTDDGDLCSQSSFLYVLQQYTSLQKVSHILSQPLFNNPYQLGIDAFIVMELSGVLGVQETTWDVWRHRVVAATKGNHRRCVIFLYITTVGSSTCSDSHINP